MPAMAVTDKGVRPLTTTRGVVGEAWAAAVVAPMVSASGVVVTLCNMPGLVVVDGPDDGTGPVDSTGGELVAASAALKVPM